MTRRDLTVLTPVEIDTELARLWEAEQLARTRAAQYRRLAGGPDNFSAERYAREAGQWATKAEAARNDAAPYEAEFRRRGGWFRYFLVTNGNGHVHREMNCRTCYPTTRYAWLIDLAGCDEKAMVEEWGERACTVCFKDAPANPNYYRPARIDREEREKREAEKARKAAEKEAKAIHGHDGGSLRVPTGTYKNFRTGEVEMGYETIKTKVAARNALSDAVQSYAWYGPDHPGMFVGRARVLVLALEAAGINTAPVIDRAAKKAKKEGATHTFPVF